jgi:hypothetical protein
MHEKFCNTVEPRSSGIQGTVKLIHNKEVSITKRSNLGVSSLKGPKVISTTKRFDRILTKRHSNNLHWCSLIAKTALKIKFRIKFYSPVLIFKTFFVKNVKILLNFNSFTAKQIKHLPSSQHFWHERQSKWIYIHSVNLHQKFRFHCLLKLNFIHFMWSSNNFSTLQKFTWTNSWILLILFFNRSKINYICCS